MHTYMHTELIPGNMSSSKEYISDRLCERTVWLPNENISDCHLTLNLIGISIVYRYIVCIMLKFIGINKEKQICPSNEEYTVPQIRKYSWLPEA